MRHRIRLGVPAALACLCSAALTAQEAAPVYTQPDYPLLRWAILIVVLVAIWAVLYKGLYPLFLRAYSHHFSRQIFWTLGGLYTATWLVLSWYLLLQVGFYFEWLKWLSAFLAGLWLVAAVALLLRRDPA